MFEQSLLFNQHANKPWSFLASFTAELVIVSLAFLIPLAYTDHLQVFHWKDLTVGPPPLARPISPPPMRDLSSAIVTPPLAPHPRFQWNPKTTLDSPQAPSTDFVAEAPPALGIGPGGSTSTLGRFIPNIIATPPSKPFIEEHKPVQKQSSAPIQVGGDVQMAKLVRKVLPEYPQIARAARISGVVRLIGIIAKDGTIRDLRIVSGHPMLSHAAMEAVQQWVYKPTLLNGIPVEVIAPIEVSFTLGQ